MGQRAYPAHTSRQIKTQERVMSVASIRLPRLGGFSIGKGVVLAVLSAAGFSAKAIFVKLAYAYSVDAVTLLLLRMVFALPFFMLMAGMGARGAAPMPRR